MKEQDIIAKRILANWSLYQTKSGRIIPLPQLNQEEPLSIRRAKAKKLASFISNLEI